MLNITNIPAPRVPIIDVKTGYVSREWYLFFLNIFNLTGQGSNQVSLQDLQQGPPTADWLLGNVASYDSQTLVETLPRSELGTMAAVQQDDVRFLRYSTIPSPPIANPSVGYTWWDGGTTLNIQMTSNVTQSVGEDQFFYIKAEKTAGTPGPSSSITKGQVVMFTGSVGASGVLTGQPATGITDGAYIMGVAAEDIPANGLGLVQSFGLVEGIDTTGGGEAWVDGQIVYYNPAVAGGLTATVPSAPNVKATIAAIVKASANGSLFVRPTYGSALGVTDSNVQITSVANNDILQYYSTGGYWRNVAASSITVTTATNLAGGLANQIPYQTSANNTSFISAPTLAGTYLSWNGTGFAWASAGTGSVTSVSVVSANGLAGTVATATTTPAITLSTTITGMLKGNGTAISAASSTTDYVAPGAYTAAPLTMATARLLGRTTASTGAAEEISVGSGLTLSAGTLTATGSGGTVTSVSVVSANGFAGTVANSTTTPAITLTTSITGVLKGNGTEISAASAGTDYVAPGGALGTPSSGTLTNCTGLLTTGGGTGLSSYTAGDIVYYASGTAFNKLAIGAANTVMTSSGSAPQWSTSLTLAGSLSVNGNTTLGDASGDTTTINGTTVSCPNNLNFGSTTLYVDSTNKRVGVGTTPVYTFDVAADSTVTNIFRLGQTGVSNGYTIVSNGTSLTHRLFTGATEDITLSTGSLSVASGVTTTLNGAVACKSTLSVDGNTTLGDASTDTVTIKAKTITCDNDLNFDSNTLYIDAANNRVGVGATPAYRLDVVADGGSQNIFRAAQSGVSNGYTITSNGTNLTHIWNYGGSEAGRFDTNGYLLVDYTTSNGAYKLQVNSQIFATSSTIATSDARYKQNVAPIQNALSMVAKLNPVTFNWIKHPVHDFDLENTTTGFLAQEIQVAWSDKAFINSIVKRNQCTIKDAVINDLGEVLEPAVTEEFLGIAEGNMIAILTAAIKELKAEFDAYKETHP